MKKMVNLYYELYGSGSPLVLIHGFPLDHTIWLPLVPLLQGSALLILPDLRGHGSSPVPRGPYSMHLLAEDILRMLDTLRIDRAVLAGHSMGGYIALDFVHSFPDRLAGMAIVSSQAFADSSERRQKRYETALEVSKNGMRNLAEAMAQQLSSRPELKSYLVNLLLRAKPMGVSGALKGMAEREDASGWLKDIKVPVVLIYGLKDSLIPCEKTRAMLAGLQKGFEVEIPEAEHMPMLETPQQVAEAFRKLMLLSF